MTRQPFNNFENIFVVAIIITIRLLLAIFSVVVNLFARRERVVVID